MQPDKLKFIEFNADSPAGQRYVDFIESTIIDSEIFSQFKKQYKPKIISRGANVLKTLLNSYTNWQGKKKNRKPRIAIVDWREEPTFAEFEMFAEFFRSKGFEAFFADIRDVEVLQGRVFAARKEVDIIYRRALINKLAENADESEGLFKAGKENLVCIVNPFMSRIASSKAILEILTDESNRNFWNKREHAAITQLLPWTHRLQFGFAKYKDENVELIPFVRKNKDLFVMKSSSGYGGKQVILGPECNKDKWDECLDNALSDKSWVVQEYIDIPRITVPVLDGSLSFKSFKANFSPFVVNRKYSGAMSRLSTSSIINVSTGAGVIPVITVKPR